VYKGQFCKISQNSISQAKQGEWMRWEIVEQCKMGWQDLWSMEESRINFLIRSKYDVLPSPLLDFGDAEQWFQWLANVLDSSNT